MPYDRIPAGAYVLRNKKLSTVLHIEDPDANKPWSPVLAFAQDENLYPNQQIWWIEPLADYADSEGELAYSITNPASGRSLDMNASESSTPDNDDRIISAYQHHGVPWQRWRFSKHDKEEQVFRRDFYSIINVMNEQVVDLIKGKSSTTCKSKKLDPMNDQHYWELVIPAVAFPPGWIQIQNVGNGSFLCHDYLHNSPTLKPPPESPRASQHRESWGLQWTMVDLKCYPTAAYQKNSWCIVNRLTSGGLTSSKVWTMGGAPSGDVAAWSKSTGGASDTMWRLELDRNYNWRIINRASSFLLEKTSDKETEVACVDQTFSLTQTNKSWILRPPILDAKEVPPPKYDP